MSEEKILERFGDHWKKMFDLTQGSKVGQNWILVGRIPKICETPEEMMLCWESDNRIIRKSRVGNVEVSTVFLPIDHGMWREGPPVLFETMVFGGVDNEYQWRYCTYEEAVLGHRAVLHEVNKLEWDRLYGDMWKYLTGVFILTWFVEEVLL